MPLRLSINPKFRSHHCGSQVEGKLILDTDEHINLDTELQLDLASYEETNDGNGNSENNSNENTLLVMNTECHRKIINTTSVETFPNIYLEKGTHSFYFSIYLPQDLPTKFKAKDCSLTYALEASLLGSEVHSRVNIDVYNLIPEPSPKLTYIGPVSKKLSYHCIKLGEVTMGVLLDKLIIYPGCILGFQCAIKNCSAAVIDEVTLTIHENTLKKTGPQRSVQNNIMTQYLDACIFTGSSSDDLLQVTYIN